MENYEGCRAIYGDSVTKFTPVYLRVNNKVDICAIEDVVEKYGKNWEFFDEEGKEDKE